MEDQNPWKPGEKAKSQIAPVKFNNSHFRGFAQLIPRKYKIADFT